MDVAKRKVAAGAVTNIKRYTGLLGSVSELAMMARSQAHDRYVPRATDKHGGWRCYDRLENRFLTDGELAALPPSHIEHEKVYTLQ